MDFEFTFAADRVINKKAYPPGATWSAEPFTLAWRQFAHHWPYTVPCELHEHCALHDVDFAIKEIDQSQPGDVYTMGLGFFDFDVDYFSFVPKQVWDKGLLVVFYYHEGDNPYKIKNRLDSLCDMHGLPRTCYKFVSGNSAADKLPQFVWFPDHELLYWQRNSQVTADKIHLDPRPFRFTVLNRTHKWWRATVMADLLRSGILKHSLWSYNTEVDIGDRFEDNPLQIDVLGLRQPVQDFLASGPYACDDLSVEQHNNHHLHVSQHFTQSYCHIVLETHFDADSSGGAFLTEKIFKPIKHGQPFVVAGPAGTLECLRRLGYRTFDHVMDNSYDQETNNTKRWQKLHNTIKQINQQDMHTWFAQCLDDLQHNQQLFCDSKKTRLNMLHQKIFNS